MRRTNPRAISIARQHANVQTAGILGTAGMIATLMLLWWLALVL